jgi:predicted transcriptional regulator
LNRQTVRLQCAIEIQARRVFLVEEEKDVLILGKKSSPGKTKTILGIETTALGPLEIELLDILWDLGKPADTMSIYLPMLERRRESGELIAPATVTTVLSRMAAKGVLERERIERTSVYKPVKSRKEMALDLIKEVIDLILRGDIGMIREELEAMLRESSEKN